MLAIIDQKHNINNINLKLSFLQYSGAPAVFSKENHCECYKKLVSRSWPVLFTFTYFFLIYTLYSSAGK